MLQMDSYTDVVELCAVLECLGFTVKSLDTSGEGNATQEGGTRTVVVNCQKSGLNVILESAGMSCTCPAANEQNDGFWQVSGIAGGKQQNKETGSKLLGSLPKAYRQRLSKELQEMVRSIKEHNDSDIDRPTANRSASILELSNKSASIVDLLKAGINRSASMNNLGTSEKRTQHLKVDTPPTRYRSLDTLTAAKEGLAQPRLLHQIADDNKKESVHALAHTQSTFTVSSTPGSERRRNKTSSPIYSTTTNVRDSLFVVLNMVADLRNKLVDVIKEFDEEKNDSSMSSLVLDVSKISVLKGSETSKTQFASSPNLSGWVARADLSTSKLKRFESVSTSNLGPKAIPGKTWKFSRIAPNLFKNKDSSLKGDKDGKSRVQSSFKSYVASPLRIPTVKSEGSPIPSASKKKFSHVKSTIPRPIPKSTPKKD